MFRNLWIKLRARSERKNTIADILAIPENREILLGMQRMRPPTPEQVIQDIDKVLNYSRSRDYAIWAKEAWAIALRSLDKLTDPTSSVSEVDFHRGCLSNTLDLLKISYAARNVKEDSVKERVLNNSQNGDTNSN